MISSTATYALRAVVYLASRPDVFISRAEISETTCVPHDYLLKVLHRLDTADIIESRRGPGGGYRLVKSPSTMTALDVVLAVDTIPRITTCPLGIGGDKKLCPLDRLFDDVGRAVEETFEQKKISDLLRRKRSRTCSFPSN